MRLLLLFLLMGTLAGCQFFQVLTTSKIEPQANPKDEVYLQLLVADNKDTPAWLDTTIAKTCASQRKTDFLSAIWAPIAGKLAFDIVVEKMSSYVKDTNDRSNKSYSVKGVFHSSTLRNTNCIVVYRGVIPKDENTKKSWKPSAAFVAQLEWAGPSAFVMKPLIVVAQNSVSLTKSPSDESGADGRKGTISMSLAMAESAVVQDAAGVWNLRQLGAAAITVPVVPLHTPPKFIVPIDPRSSELLPAPDQNVAVQLSFAITESGNIVGDADAAQAEIKAIAAAIGPGLEAEITRHYKED
ncbi:hypothetical protein ACUN0G_27290 [Pseudomonas sp. 32A]|uniref:hypothetical protein n=1 Tax=Pseudomonas sp. 32A TaxID=651185 RepID=UPI0040467255